MQITINEIPTTVQLSFGNVGTVYNNGDDGHGKITTATPPPIPSLNIDDISCVCVLGPRMVVDVDIDIRHYACVC